MKRNEARALDVGTALGGVIAPASAGALGACAVLRRVAYVPVGRGTSSMLLTLTGADAIGVGVFLLCAALWMHIHYYWPHREALAPHAEGAAALATFACILSGGYVAWSLWRLAIFG